MNAQPTPLQRACFELGIKFGSLYHQFVGTPVSLESAASLERAIEASIENQPYSESVSVEIDRDALRDAQDLTWGYTEFSGDLLSCRVIVSVDGIRAEAALVDVDGYPEMQIVNISEP